MHHMDLEFYVPFTLVKKKKKFDSTYKSHWGQYFIYLTNKHNDGVTLTSPQCKCCVLPSDPSHPVLSPLKRTAAVIPLTPAMTPAKREPGAEEPKKGIECKKLVQLEQGSHQYGYFTTSECRHRFGAHEPLLSAWEALIKNTPSGVIA